VARKFGAEPQAIAAFLRVLNALENIRSSIDVAERGRAMTKLSDLQDQARLSLSETVDALDVLFGWRNGHKQRGDRSIFAAPTGCGARRARSRAARAHPMGDR
jgi:hypothetical protein